MSATLEEKLNNGEVNTPLPLCIKMINLLTDYDPNFFDRENLKIYEPCCGKGNFLITLIKILAKKRSYKSIVENVIYFNDINKSNVEYCKLLIDPNNEYKLNDYNEDALKIEFNFKFDLIITNPSYNNATHKIHTGSSCWMPFIFKWMEQTNEYFINITPPRWRNIDKRTKTCTNIFKLICCDNRLISLNMNDKKTGTKVFKCGTAFDYYLVLKDNEINDTKIYDFDDTVYNINLNDKVFIPSRHLDFIYNFKMPYIIYEGKYKIRNKNKSQHCDDVLALHSLQNKKSVIQYIRDNEEIRKCKKIIFSTTTKNILKDDGKILITQYLKYIKYETEDESERIIEFLNSEDFNKLRISLCFRTFGFDLTTLSYIANF